MTHPDIWAAETTVRDRSQGVRNSSSNTFGNTHVYGISSGVLQMSSTTNMAAQPVRLVASQIPTNGDSVRGTTSNAGNDGHYRYMYLPKKTIPQNGNKHTAKIDAVFIQQL